MDDGDVEGEEPDDVVGEDVGDGVGAVGGEGEEPAFFSSVIAFFLASEG